MSENLGPRRPFATGSKPGPDAVDHYLEEKGFYRKHVARDASSLFRVVSEQVFDIQNYHEKVRQDCAGFMEARAKEYSNEVDKNFYNYINLLRRNRTHGTLLELRVLAKMYKKNVILFEPTQNLQTVNHVYVQNDAYDSENPLRVFYSHKDKHFDTIYTMEYTEKLAECQSIVYEILYTNVFKLPDVQYAVERMLHDQDEQLTLPLSHDPTKYETQAGDIVDFDLHEDTNCVLKDPRTCHFHNQVNFYEVFDENKDAITVINRTDETGGLKIYKLTDGFLHDKEKSCVRQLLEEKITPFPYKVAKALDPSIYRNTEFELWSENRKEQRLKWLDSDFPPKQLDDKWFVYDTEKYRRNGFCNMRKFSDHKYEQAVVDEKAYMALDDDMKKKYIILDPSAEPFKFNNFANFDHFIPAKDSLEYTVMPANINNFRGGYKKRGGGRYSNNTYHHNQGHMNSPHNSQWSSNQQQPIPHVSDIERDGTRQIQDQQEQQPIYHQQSQTEVINQEQQFSYEQQSNQGQPQMFPVHSPYPFGGQLMPYIQQQPQYQVHPGQPIQYSGQLSYQQVMPFGNFSIPPPVAVIQTAAPPISSPNGNDPMNIMRDCELASNCINWKPKESAEQGGADLPLSDVPTLQFYYNLGVRYFLASGVQRRLDSVVTQLEALEMNENNFSSHGVKQNEQQLKTDPPPVPTNTPVSTKPATGNYLPPGKSWNNNHGRNLRPFNNPSINRDARDPRDGYRNNFNNPRKEIKFNSNVKNVHKNESKVASEHNVHQNFQNNQQYNSSNNRANASTSTTLSGHEKLSPGSVTPAPMISPIMHENPQQLQAYVQQPSAIQDQQPQQGHIQQQTPFFQPFQPQTFMTPQQQGVAMVYQVNDEGFMQPVQQQIAYPQPYQFIQPQPMYYPVPNYQHSLDNSVVSSNDSGVVDQNGYPQYYQPAPVPIYYTQSPLPQSSQIAQIAPVFPAPQQSHSQGNLAQVPVAAVAPQISGSLERSISTVSTIDASTAENNA